MNILKQVGKNVKNGVIWSLYLIVDRLFRNAVYS